ncbi:DUF1206 domain-containing protein [Erythrobacter sp. SD-21]|uniref:DUF1206 domain-containing protein n=1 Tax=Erythrobacter sp. SD-21 TaxID=161528 RepID=UPI000153F737|nr:DUF1206 domain-containing protein [Erythrobacter sp. SD-21]EDL50233.1 hypothetical protein ED21_27218 [Erythrobacter sp. SD-21]
MVDKSEKFSWLVRIGFAARGITYLLLGYIALSTRGDAEGGGSAVYDYLQEVPIGTPILWTMTAGLLAYVAFRLMCAISDLQHRGTDSTGILKRIGDGASAVAHLFLAYACFQFATGEKSSSDGDSGGKEMAGSILQMEIGWIVIGAIGLGFLIGAFMQAKTAFTAHFMHRISARAPSITCPIGRAGHAARAIVFLLIGWSMIKGAWVESEERIQGLGQAILSLRDTGLIYSVVAIGLIMFGIFSLFTARYRIIPDFGPEGLKPSFRS